MRRWRGRLLVTKARIEKLIGVWTVRLGLERWKIDVDWSKPCADHNVAEIEKSSFYDTGTIRLEPGWAKWAPDYAEQTVVHELLHLLHRDVDEAFADIEGQLQRDAWTMVERRYKQAMEGFIDRTASRLVELAA
jgi:hypothetical protein